MDGEDEMLKHKTVYFSDTKPMTCYKFKKSKIITKYDFFILLY